MRVVFFGTPRFAVPTLARLLDSHHTCVAVVTQPDKPAGRGLKLTPPPVKVLAESRGVPVLQPVSVRKPPFEDELRALNADVAVVVAYGKILPANILAVPAKGFLNVHASLLPAYRGAGPVQWAIVRGEKVTGISIMQLDEGMDTGPVVSRSEVDILEDDDAMSLADMLSAVGADEMMKVLDRLEREGSLASEPQDHSKATYAPLIEREQARIDWKRPAEEIILLVRGMVPWPKAFTTVPGAGELKVTAADAWVEEWRSEEAIEESKPGAVVDVVRGRGVTVRAGDGRVILLKRVQPANKSEMDAEDCARGGLLKVGTVLGG